MYSDKKSFIVSCPRFSKGMLQVVNTLVMSLWNFSVAFPFCTMDSKVDWELGFCFLGGGGSSPADGEAILTTMVGFNGEGVAVGSGAGGAGLASNLRAWPLGFLENVPSSCLVFSPKQSSLMTAPFSPSQTAQSWQYTLPGTLPPDGSVKERCSPTCSPSAHCNVSAALRLASLFLLRLSSDAVCD